MLPASALPMKRSLAIPSNVIGRALAVQGHFQQAEPLLAQAAPLVGKIGESVRVVLALGFLGFVLAAQGNPEAGTARDHRGALPRPSPGHSHRHCDSHAFASLISMQQGAYDEMLVDRMTALEEATGVDDHLLVSISHNTMRMGAHAASEIFSKPKRALHRTRKCPRIWAGHSFSRICFFAAFCRRLALRQNRLDEAVVRAERGVQAARRRGECLFGRIGATRVGSGACRRAPDQTRSTF